MVRILLLVTAAILLAYCLSVTLERLVAAAARLLRPARQTASRWSSARRRPQARDARRSPERLLVRCTVCGVHVAESRSLMADETSSLRFCSQTCRQRAAEAS